MFFSGIKWTSEIEVCISVQFTVQNVARECTFAIS